jgi:hypothetical protein
MVELLHRFYRCKQQQKERLLEICLPTIVRVVPLTEGVTTKATKINQIKVTKSLLASMKFVTG